ncbi:MAG: hypothetical protein RJA29_150, partial [Pseudomonadota bacterium]
QALRKLQVVSTEDRAVAEVPTGTEGEARS